MNTSKNEAVDKVPTVVIRPPKGWPPIRFKDLITYRELVYFFAWRDIKIRYKQTAFGLAWAVIQPVLMMLVFTLFFGLLAQVPSEGVPYPLFTYAALLPWTLFAEGLSRSSNSLVSDSNLIQKVYFPRIIVPFASVISPLIDFFIAFIVLIGLMLFYGYLPTLLMLWLPVFLILELMLTLGLGLWLSAINVEYRDIRYAIPFVIQLLLFASPIIYSSSFVPERFQAAYGMINPISGIIEGFRWAILGSEPPSFTQLITSAIIILVILYTGALFFRRREAKFADCI